MRTRKGARHLSEPVIVVICGSPGAGKTTVATRVADRLEARGEPVRLVHSDDFSRRTYERLFERVADGPDDVTWLVDGTFYRREWQERFRTLGDVRFVLVTASLETCLERNRRREDAIDEQGVHVVFREFDEPAADLEVDTDELSATEAVERVLEALDRWRSA
ncbi:ATP-binding protein [Natronococcus amylolyticus]|uniref:ATP-binding protein n=1 Tax=Natronococcus amylolyticus TaxID=44470 RepID=UPI0009FD32C3|nr:zeta toxin family protein [Natronococcus amylolyticus]